MRLIDADALNLWGGVNNSGVWVRYKDVVRFIKDAPTIDAVPVVWCRECIAHCCCYHEDRFMERGIKDGYCRAGKRREDGGE